jgi:hypothetical protein
MMANILKLTILLAFTSLLSCKSTKIAPLDSNILSEVRADVTYLSSDDLEGRETGTEGEKKAAEYIVGRYKELGLEGIMDIEESFYQFFQKTIRSNPHATEDNPNDPVIIGRNVIGYKNNNAPYTIIIGAHYDHLGYGGQGSLYVGPPAIHNGADDNASGVAAMLALADYFNTHTINSNILYIAFSGEEKGLWGSNYFVDHSPIDLVDFNFMVNMDMIGRLNEERQLAIYGTGTSSVWNDIIHSIKQPKFKYSIQESGIGPSDHTSFYLEGIPVLHFFTGQHEDYHKPTDDVEKINFAGLGDIISYISQVITKADNKGKLTYVKTKDESQEVPDFKVTLGVIPDYLFDGKGMRIDGVREDRPASNAGMIKGDIVKRMGDREIVDMMSYMKALGAFNPGETIKVKLDRDGKTIVKDVTF